MKTWADIDSVIKTNPYGSGINGAGDKNADVVIVGEAPDQADKSLNRVFSGRKGVLIQKALDDVGISSKSVYFTNAVKVASFNGKSANRQLIDFWRPVLNAEINLVKPDFIIALGPIARQSLYSVRQVDIITFPRLNRNTGNDRRLNKLRKEFQSNLDRITWNRGHIE